MYEYLNGFETINVLGCGFGFQTFGKLPYITKNLNIWSF